MIRDDLTLEQYHALPSLSSSRFRVFCQDRIDHYERYIVGDNPWVDTSSLRTGTVYHALLEGDADSIAVIPEDIKVRRGKKWDAFKHANAGKTCMFAHEFDNVRQMLDRVQLHSEADRIVSTEGECEISYLCEYSELHLRCRTDKHFAGGQYVVDYKSLQDATLAGFRRSIGKWRYDLQQAFYEHVMACCGVTVEEFYFLVQKNAYPWTVGVYQIGHEWMNEARDMIAKALDKYGECLRKNWWLPSHYGQLQVIASKPYGLNMELED